MLTGCSAPALTDEAETLPALEPAALGDPPPEANRTFETSVCGAGKIAYVGVPEDLLAAAKQCLSERGYARTTVRDIVAVSGSNLAAINYHFRSKDALLAQAMIETTGDAVAEVLKAFPDDSQEWFETFWAQLIESFRANPMVWRANVETLAQAPHLPDIRARLAEGQALAQRELGRRLPHQDEAGAQVLLTLLIGLLVRWQIDPDNAPTAHDLAAGIRSVADAAAG
ncbi:TetR/AcrR family transcriptional regulator [Nonomuraea sp. bgisy101]|uniref:TetR/AcrR family transcriptional regulator n=1 Tax=Nonomuraea sp. bgisy101 TaxID=3413784 RepID=UPI003D732EA0